MGLSLTSKRWLMNHSAHQRGDDTVCYLICPFVRSDAQRREREGERERVIKGKIHSITDVQTEQVNWLIVLK